MYKFQIRSLLIIFIFLFFVPLYSAEDKEEIKLEFSPETFEAHVRFLSDDLLEGRGTGVRGGKIARLYIESVFRSAGLKPSLDGSYLQPFKMNRYSPDADARLVFKNPEAEIALIYGDDFVCTNFDYSDSAVFDKIVFIGYGIHLPEEGWDFYRDYDVRDKLLIGFTNEPGQDNPDIFNGKALTWFGRWVYKYEEAARQGAAGLIIIHNTGDAGYSWDVVRNSWSGDTLRLADDPNILPMQLWISEPKAEKIVKLSGYSLKKLRGLAESPGFKPVELDINVKVKSEKRIDETMGNNVVGYIPGSDAALKDRYVVLTAHYDHLGIGRSINGDAIYNGAVDNGTAIATLLALAQEYGRHPEAAGVTLVFAAVDAEEEGLLGSTYLARNMIYPVKDALANINFEMSNAWGRTKDIFVIGAEKSSLDELIKDVAKDLSMSVTYDQTPEQGYFYRSDQMSFARIGIPSVWLDTGYEYVDKPEGYGHKIRSAYRENDYHRPSDEIKDNWDFSGLVQLAEITVELIKKIEDKGLVKWMKDAEFHR